MPVACVPKHDPKSGGRPMVTRIEIREIPPKANKSSAGLTVAQKKLLKRKYKEADASLAYDRAHALSRLRCQIPRQ